MTEKVSTEPKFFSMEKRMVLIMDAYVIYDAAKADEFARLIGRHGTRNNCTANYLFNDLSVISNAYWFRLDELISASNATVAWYRPFAYNKKRDNPFWSDN